MFPITPISACAAVQLKYKAQKSYPLLLLHDSTHSRVGYARGPFHLCFPKGHHTPERDTSIAVEALKRVYESLMGLGRAMIAIGVISILALTKTCNRVRFRRQRR
jgi:hypothetical protein